MSLRCVFVTGATGYVGSRLIPRLLERGCEVRALVRKESVGKVPPGCRIIHGDPLDSRTFAAEVTGSDTFVQLVGAAKLRREDSRSRGAGHIHQTLVYSRAGASMAASAAACL